MKGKPIGQLNAFDLQVLIYTLECPCKASIVRM